MGKIFAEIDDQLELKFRELILKKFGARKGALETAVEEAIRLWIERESKSQQATPSSEQKE